MAVLHSTIFLQKRDIIKVDARHLEGCDSFTANIAIDDRGIPVAPSQVDVHADSLDQLLDLGYAIVNACRKLQGVSERASVAERNAGDFEAIDFGESLEANVPHAINDAVQHAAAMETMPKASDIPY